MADRSRDSISEDSPLRSDSRFHDLEPKPPKERQPRTQFAQTALARAARTPIGLFLTCFFAGAILFIASMAALALWFGGGGAFGSSDDYNWLALPSPGGRAEQGAAPPPGVLRSLPAQELRIFFTTDGLHLESETVPVESRQSAQERLRMALTELLDGPNSDFLKPAVPEGTTLRAVYMDGDTAVVDLSEEIRRPLGGPMSEVLCVYAIVNTVIENVDAAKTVRLLIDGKTQLVLWEQVDLTEPLAADASLVRY